jgi:hypothetical protein
MIIQTVIKMAADEFAEGFDPTVIPDLAESYGVNPILIERKFQEQYNCTPEKYAAKVANAADLGKRVEAGNRETAIEQARVAHYTNFLSEPGKYCGKIIDFMGSEYAFIAFVRGTKWNALGIRVSDGTVRRLSCTPDDMLQKLSEAE